MGKKWEDLGFGMRRSGLGSNSFHLLVWNLGETLLTPLSVIFLFCNEGFRIPMCKFVPGGNGEWLGKVLYTVGIIIRDDRVVQFFDQLLFQEGREARGQEGQRSVGKQVVGLFLGDSFPMSQAY